jgi:hypothetical protein
MDRRKLEALHQDVMQARNYAEEAMMRAQARYKRHHTALYILDKELERLDRKINTGKEKEQ